jgi:NTP pyrophosphatase (non-canonical NTP hydrolase)
MNFEQFQQNVQTWAAARGIYEHSTPLAQALKAVSEVGELADAVIKNDRDALKDAIGDVAVCLVNVAAMLGASSVRFEVNHGLSRGPLQVSAGVVAQALGNLTINWYIGASDKAMRSAAQEALADLEVFSRDADLTFEECCQAAWDEIKDRTGHMVAGGAFVKD